LEGSNVRFQPHPAREIPNVEVLSIGRHCRRCPVDQMSRPPLNGSNDAPPFSHFISDLIAFRNTFAHNRKSAKATVPEGDAAIA